MIHTDGPYLLGELCEGVGKHREQLGSAPVSCQRQGQEEKDKVREAAEHGHQAH